MRIVIAGAPRCGKSTLLRELALDFPCAVSTDDFIHHTPWEEVPNACIRVLEKYDSWALEGVNAVRVLRRWIRDLGTCPLIDKVYYLTKPMAPRKPAHESMAKGIHKQWREVEPWLLKMGVEIVREVPSAS